jgi:hypothetical protein
MLMMQPPFSCFPYSGRLRGSRNTAVGFRSDGLVPLFQRHRVTGGAEASDRRC